MEPFHPPPEAFPFTELDDLLIHGVLATLDPSTLASLTETSPTLLLTLLRCFPAHRSIALTAGVYSFLAALLRSPTRSEVLRSALCTAPAPRFLYDPECLTAGSGSGWREASLLRLLRPGIPLEISFDRLVCGPSVLVTLNTDAGDRQLTTAAEHTIHVEDLIVIGPSSSMQSARVASLEAFMRPIVHAGSLQRLSYDGCLEPLIQLFASGPPAAFAQLKDLVLQTGNGSDMDRAPAWNLQDTAHLALPPSLRRLTLQGYGISPAPYGAIADLVRRCPQLIALHLGTCNAMAAQGDIVNLARLFAGVPDLRSLGLSMREDPAQRWSAHLSAAPFFTRLRSLTLDLGLLTAEVVDVLLALPCLVSLSLAVKTDPAGTLQALLRRLLQTSHLTAQLQAFGLALTDVHNYDTRFLFLYQLTPMLKGLKQLRSLALFNVRVSRGEPRESAVYEHEHLPSCLTYLSLDNTMGTLGPRGMRAEESTKALEAAPFRKKLRHLRVRTSFPGPFTFEAASVSMPQQRQNGILAVEASLGSNRSLACGSEIFGSWLYPSLCHIFLFFDISISPSFLSPTKPYITVVPRARDARDYPREPLSQRQIRDIEQCGPFCPTLGVPL